VTAYELQSERCILEGLPIHLAMGGAEDNPLIAIQDEVRTHFGWELQADIASANSMRLNLLDLASGISMREINHWVIYNSNC
jgi:hypothetical protein